MSKLERKKSLIKLIEGEGAEIVSPSMLLPASVFFDLAGEEFGRRLLLTTGNNDVEYCLRPDFTLPIAIDFLENKNDIQSAAFGYIGSIFRQRATGAEEFNQAGIELLGQKNADTALNRVFDFALASLKIYKIKPKIRIGSVEIFESLLENLDISKVWLPRIRHRFGQQKNMARLLERLANPHEVDKNSAPKNKDELIAKISEKMRETGLSLTGSRSPEEIVNRYFEKQALAASKVDKKIINLLKDYLAIKGEASVSLAKIEVLAAKNNLDISKPLERLKSYIKTLKEKYQIEEIIFDASFSPRLDYYTGIVFEMSSIEKIICSGGEYHRLLEKIGAQKQMNACGCALWIDRMDKQAQANKGEQK